MNSETSIRYFLINKPYGVLSQFTPEAGHKSLKDVFDFPGDVYPVGRLDTDSEGLLLITNDKKLNHLLLDPKFGHNRTYWAQVDGEINEEALRKLENSVEISVNGKIHRTRPAKAKIIESPVIEERNPPIRFRKNIPTCWISLTLTEGKNRQVRKMTAAVGFPTLRLVRYSIEGITLLHLKPGEFYELTRKEIYKGLKIPL